jgi:hypothetical protein
MTPSHLQVFNRRSLLLHESRLLICDTPLTSSHRQFQALTSQTRASQATPRVTHRTTAFPMILSRYVDVFNKHTLRLGHVHLFQRGEVLEGNERD